METIETYASSVIMHPLRPVEIYCFGVVRDGLISDAPVRAKTGIYLAMAM